MPKYRPPIASTSGQWQANTHARTSTYDYRSSSTQNIPYSSGTAMYQGMRGRPDLSDDEEMWRQRSRQHSDEMSAAVARARQRREEDEKRYEQSRLAAQEKARALEEKAKQAAKGNREKLDTVEQKETRESAQPRENHETLQSREPQPKRDNRDLPHNRKARENRDNKHGRENIGHEDRLLVNEGEDKRLNKESRISNSYSNSGYGNKLFNKYIPPRFQKQAELQRQMLQQSWAPSPLNGFEQGAVPRSLHYDQQPYPAMRSNSSYTSSRVSNRSRSDSQGSVSEGYNNEERWNRRSQSRENWRSQKEASSESVKNVDSSSVEKETSENILQTNLQNKVTEERHREKSTESSSTRSESRTSLTSRESSLGKLEEKKSTSDYHESILNNRTSVPKEGNFKNRDRLDWSTESDNSYLSCASHLDSSRRDWHRPVSITQNQFESVIGPVKSNLISLRKGGIQERKNSDFSNKATSDKNETLTSREKNLRDLKTEESKSLPQNVEMSKKNEIQSDKSSKIEEKSTIESESMISKSESCSPKSGSEGQASQETTNQSSNKSDLSSVSQEKNNNNNNEGENFSPREKHGKEYYESGSRSRHHGYNRGQGSPFRGSNRSYRRPRTSAAPGTVSSAAVAAEFRGPRYDKYRSSQAPRMHSKSRKKVHNSEENSQENTRPKSSTNQIQSVSVTNMQSDNSSKSKDQNSGKEKVASSANHQTTSTSNSAIQSNREESSKRNRGSVAYRNITVGLSRTYGSSNYGPPSSKPAFGETRGNSAAKVNTENSETRNEQKATASQQVSSDSQNKNNSKSSSNKESSSCNVDERYKESSISHTSSRNSNSKNIKDTPNYRRSGISGDSSMSSHRAKEVPPRFLKKQNPSRSNRMGSSGSSRNTATGKDDQQTMLNIHSSQQWFSKCPKDKKVEIG